MLLMSVVLEVEDWGHFHCGSALPLLHKPANAHNQLNSNWLAPQTSAMRLQIAVTNTSGCSCL